MHMYRYTGEGTDAEFTGYLNGAYRTGIVQARALLEKLSGARGGAPGHARVLVNLL